MSEVDNPQSYPSHDRGFDQLKFEQDEAKARAQRIHEAEHANVDDSSTDGVDYGMGTPTPTEAEEPDSLTRPPHNASKKRLIEYAEATYDVVLSDKMKVAELNSQIDELEAEAAEDEADSEGDDEEDDE